MTVNLGVRTAQAADGGLVILAAWCARCAAEVMPDRDGCCLWCRTRVVDEDRLKTKAALAAIDMDGGRMSETDATCKIDGCDERALTQFGPYGRLCGTHKAEAGQARGRVAGTGARSGGRDRRAVGWPGQARGVLVG